MIKASLPIRGSDKHGSGHYGAPRGSRTHKGIDFSCYPDTEIYPRYPGKVTKLGYPYADKLQYRYVQVTDEFGNDHRYFYVEPMVELNQQVFEDTIIGTAQDLTKVYPGIINHIHYEIKQDGVNINPENFA